jgi:hypothetical protein
MTIKSFPARPRTAIISRYNPAVLSTSLAVFVLGATDAAAACIVAVDYSGRREFGRNLAQLSRVLD